jgi:predicted small lipoprotein YifL
VIRPERPLSRLVLIGAFAAAFALGACGRKGPLDAPPGGATAVSQTDQEQRGQTDALGQPTQQASPNDNLISRGGTRGLPRIRGEDKSIPLDVLLN